MQGPQHSLAGAGHTCGAGALLSREGPLAQNISIIRGSGGSANRWGN